MSNAIKHTPGPWRFYTEPQPNGCPIVGSGGLMVAMLAHSVNHEDQKEEALANAKLIAAAPDLLEALRALLTAEMLHETAMSENDVSGVDAANEAKWPAVDAAHAAITKATGK